MAVRFRQKTQRPIPGVRYVSRDEGAERLDRAAHKWLNMSGEECVRRFEAGESHQSVLKGESGRGRP